MRLLPHEVALGILADEFDSETYPDPQAAFDGKAGAFRFLARLSGENFGMNVEKWKAWFAECDSELLQQCYESLENEDPT